jgi:hypothetical protein
MVGNSVVSNSIPSITLDDDNRHASSSEAYVYHPEKPLNSSLMTYSIFPRRGGLAGETNLSILGANWMYPCQFTSVKVNISVLVVILSPMAYQYITGTRGHQNWKRSNPCDLPIIIRANHSFLEPNSSSSF